MSKVKEKKDPKKSSDVLEPSVSSGYIEVRKKESKSEEDLPQTKGKKREEVEDVDHEEKDTKEKERDAGSGRRTSPPPPPKEEGKRNSRSRSRGVKRTYKSKIERNKSPEKEKEKENIDNEIEDFDTYGEVEAPEEEEYWNSKRDKDKKKKYNEHKEHKEKLEEWDLDQDDMDWREMGKAYGWTRNSTSDRYSEDDVEYELGKGEKRGRSGQVRTGNVPVENNSAVDTQETDDIPPNMLVKLSVGGERYLTTFLTLKSFGENFITRMVRNDLKGTISSIKDDDGYYFIDRNGKVFEFVLDYLREHSSLVLPPSVPYHRVIRELEFYGIPYRGILQLEPKYTKASMEAITHWQSTVDKIVALHIQKWKTTINQQIMKGCCPVIIKHSRTDGPKFHYGPFSYNQAHSGLFRKLLSLTLHKRTGIPTSVHLELTDNPMELSNLCLVFNLDDDMLRGRKYDFPPTNYSDWTLNKLHDVMSSVVVRGSAGTGFRMYSEK